MVSIHWIFSSMFQMRLIIVILSVISDIYGQPPHPFGDDSPPPILDTNPESVEVVAGETASLPCTVTNLGINSISWLTSSYEKLTDNEQIMIDDDPRLSVNVIGDTSWNLLIENVNGEDSGTYICMVQAIPPQMKQVQLTVKAKPFIPADSFPSIYQVAEGKSLLATCITTGNPRPEVSWYYFQPVPGSQLGVKEPFQGGHMLTINKVRKSDAGRYRCEAVNSIGHVYREMNLIVNYKPEIEMPTKVIPVKQGSNAILECTVESNPLPEILWIRSNYKLSNSYKHKVEMYVDSQTRKTAILTVKQTDQEDRGKYRCMARNTVGQMEKFVYINVIQVTTTTTSTTTTTTTSTTSLTTTPSITIETTMKRVANKGTTKPDNLIKITKDVTTQTTANPANFGETRSSSSRTFINSFTLLSTLSLLYLYKLL